MSSTAAVENAAHAGAHAAHAHASHVPDPASPSEYIQHHLHHWQKDFSFNDAVQHGIVDFSLFNLDSVLWSIVLGALVCFFLWRAARKATAGVPGRFQAGAEMLFEMVDNQAKELIHNEASRKFVAPLALTVFLWIIVMNTMDLIPVDFIPAMWQWFNSASLGHDPHHTYMRVLPTADLSTTLGLSGGVLLLCFYYSLKVKGMGGWAHELVSAPFGTSKNPLFAIPLAFVNFAMQIIEFLAKTVSHGMRLFGNMFAGELVFMLIALMGMYASTSLAGIGFGIGHVLAGVVWSIFHILVIVLQAFIFMMLTLIYIGQAHDAH